MRPRYHVERRQRRRRRARNVRSGPTQLLQVARTIRRFDLLVLQHTTARAHHLNPAIVRSRSDAIHLVKGIVAVFLVPEMAGVRIEAETEAIAHAVRIKLYHVRGGFGWERQIRDEVPK